MRIEKQYETEIRNFIDWFAPRADVNHQIQVDLTFLLSSFSDCRICGKCTQANGKYWCSECKHEIEEKDISKCCTDFDWNGVPPREIVR